MPGDDSKTSTQMNHTEKAAAVLRMHEQDPHTPTDCRAGNCGILVSSYAQPVPP